MTDNKNEIQQRTRSALEGVWRRTARIYLYLFPIQFVVCSALAIWITPRTWVGETSSVHIHVWASIGLGALLCSVPFYFAHKTPGSALTRHSIAIGQMAMAGLFVHVTGGRIESHFHYFAVLAILAFFRDYKVILTATVVVAADHLIRGVAFPMSLYGLESVSIWRVVEHAAHVIFEDVFLILGIWHSRQEMDHVSQIQMHNDRMFEDTARNRMEAEQMVVEAKAAAEQREESVEALAQGITGSVAKLSEQVRLTAENATGMHDTMREFSGVLALGGESVEETATKLREVAESTQVTANEIESLVSASEEIESITQMINSIAERTNLLSLNASVEASRAGDAGRGFAVVANEVKQLSSATVDSTRKIESVSANIRNPFGSGRIGHDSEPGTGRRHPMPI